MLVVNAILLYVCSTANCLWFWDIILKCYGKLTFLKQSSILQGVKEYVSVFSTLRGYWWLRSLLRAVQ